jgi:exodeoxyribonuclease V beta subunit
VTREWLERFRYDVDRWVEPVTHAIDRTLATPLDASGLTLSRIARPDRIAELEFTLPVAGGGTRLAPRDLAAVFERHAAPASIPDYHQRLRELGFAPLEGFVRGFVDLVFRHEGRFYLVDYKSNRLGPDASAYTPFRLAEAMRHHHYPLQYHLYLLALHRHLRRTLPDYDPAQHLGGIYYLFVRGMAPEHPLGTGVFHDRPTTELIEALSALFDDPGAVP